MGLCFHFLAADTSTPVGVTVAGDIMEYMLMAIRRTQNIVTMDANSILPFFAVTVGSMLNLGGGALTTAAFSPVTGIIGTEHIIVFYSRIADETAIVTCFIACRFIGVLYMLGFQTTLQT